MLNAVLVYVYITVADSDKLGEKAYRLKLIDDDEEEDIVGNRLAKRFSRLHLDDEYAKSDDEMLESSDSDDELSHVNSPIPDDTNSKCYVEIDLNECSRIYRTINIFFKLVISIIC